MKKIIFIWTIAMFLLALPSVVAGDYVFNETFHNGNNWWLASGSGVRADASGTGYLEVSNLFDTGTNPTRFVHNITKNINTTFTVAFQMNWSQTGTGEQAFFFADTNFTSGSGGSDWFYCIETTVGGSRIWCEERDAVEAVTTLIDPASNKFRNVTIIFNNTAQKAYFFLNGTLQDEHAYPSGGGIWAYFMPVGSSLHSVGIKNFRVWNGTVEPQEIQPPDTTPPSITYYNLSGCENWNTDKTNACSGSSVSPTVLFNTDENTFCALTGNYSSTLGMNYSNMGSSYNCTGAVSGEGTTSHMCTLNDNLVYENAYLYISCKDSSGNQNRTSTSSALKVSVTGLDTTAANAIGIGVQNSLLSGYTNYTNQQIYARNLVNSQVKGAYDKVAKKGNKTWAINWLSSSESYIGMFNLTPVLYTLEFANLTATNMTKQVELLVNATR